MLCWWSINFDSPQSLVEEKLVGTYEDAVEKRDLEARYQDINEHRLNASSTSPAWWEVPPGLSILARTVARKKEKPLTTSDSLQSTRQHRFSDISSESRQVLTEHQVNLLSAFKSLGSPSEAVLPKSRPITADSGVDVTEGETNMVTSLTYPEIATISTRLKHFSPQQWNDRSSDMDIPNRHNRVISQNSEAGGVYL